MSDDVSWLRITWVDELIFDSWSLSQIMTERLITSSALIDVGFGSDNVHRLNKVVNEQTNEPTSWPNRSQPTHVVSQKHTKV